MPDGPTPAAEGRRISIGGHQQAEVSPALRSRNVITNRELGRIGRKRGRTVTHLGCGTWWWQEGRGRRVRDLPPPREIEAAQPCLAGLSSVPSLTVTQVVLTGCRLAHDPSRHRPHDLATLCQRCHMLHDAPEHRRTRWRRAHMVRARGDLFG